MLFSAQIRAARGLLDWRQHELAARAGVGLSTVKRMEGGEGPVTGHGRNIWAIQAALEAGGVVFLDPGEAGAGPGVCLAVATGAPAVPGWEPANRDPGEAE